MRCLQFYSFLLLQVCYLFNASKTKPLLILTLGFFWLHVCMISWLVFVGSQIILSIKLSIQNNNHTHEHKYLHGKSFLLKRKNHGTNSNQFTIIKSIIIILVYVSRLKKNLSYSSLLSHTLISSLKDSNTLLSPLYFSSPCTALSWLSSLYLSGSL